MALKLQIATQFGPAAPQAYARITNFYGTKDQIQVQVEVHATEQARQQGWPSVAQHAHYINMEDLPGDLIPAMYSVLKTLTVYQGAEDI